MKGIQNALLHYADFVAWVDFACWWSYIGQGLRLEPVQQAYLMSITNVPFNSMGEICGAFNSTVDTKLSVHHFVGRLYVTLVLLPLNYDVVWNRDFCPIKNAFRNEEKKTYTSLYLVYQSIIVL